MIVRRACVVLVAIASLVACGTSAALELPATCRDQAPLAGKPATIAELRQRVESIGETDPAEAVRILCVTIPRVAAEYGGDSLELAQWAQNLATPLIAYFDKFAEARAFLTGDAVTERILTLSTPIDGREGERLSAFVQAHAACVAAGFDAGACPP